MSQHHKFKSANSERLERAMKNILVSKESSNSTQSEIAETLVKM